MCNFARQKVLSPMRHFLVLAPLGMLLFSSCKPDGGSSAAGSVGRGEDSDAQEKVSHARLAAQDSVSKAPQPRNLIAAIEDICPVHHEKMKPREIPFILEEPQGEGNEAAHPVATAAFPFGAEKIVSSGNALLPGETLTARVYQCASCIAARRLAEARRKPSDPAAKPE